MPNCTLLTRLRGTTDSIAAILSKLTSGRNNDQPPSGPVSVSCLSLLQAKLIRFNVGVYSG